MSAFESVRRMWLLEARRRVDEARQRAAENADSECGIELRIVTLEQERRKHAAWWRRHHQQTAAPQSGASRPVAPGRSLPSSDRAPHFSLAPLDMGRAVLVPSGALFFGGDRAWRCEVSP